MAAVDAYLDPSTGDLPDRNQLVTGPALIRQRAAIRLGTQRGEWFLDLPQGMPFAEWSELRPVDTGEVIAFIRTELSAIPGVSGLRNFTATVDQTARRLDVEGEILTDAGEVLALSVAQDPAQALVKGRFWVIELQQLGVTIA